ncbi:MAG TPA: alpha/beta hydrolase [Aestuariivirgaceae bacterium]|nr:alpha/beta hydrolase [Aestuariivirgaceae bacterium]
MSFTAVRSAFSVVGDGPPVFLIHGIGASRQSWDGLVEHLKHEFRCIAYDLRGHGKSPIPPPPCSLSDLVADLEALRAELGIERAHFFGHSLGAMIAPAYARAFPDRVMSVGLLSTAAGRTDDDSAKVMTVIAAMKENGIGPVLETLQGRWFTPEFAAARPDVIAARLRQVLDTDPAVFLSVFEIYAETEMAPWLGEVTAPALVLTGEFDGGCNPRLNRVMAATLPDSELVILPGLRHAILLEAADRVAPPVLDFLRRTS